MLLPVQRTEPQKRTLVAQRLERGRVALEAMGAGGVVSWDERWFRTLLRALGAHYEGLPFARLGEVTPWLCVLHNRDNEAQLEALLLGQAGFLTAVKEVDETVKMWQREYEFLRHKYRLTPLDASEWGKRRGRPASSPCVRLAQAAALFHQKEFLCSQVMDLKESKDLLQCFEVTASPYWDTHYSLGKESAKCPKRLGKEMCKSLVINSVVVFQYAYRCACAPALQDPNQRQEEALEAAICLLKQLPAERNSLIDSAKEAGYRFKSAFDTQAFLQEGRG